MATAIFGRLSAIPLRTDHIGSALSSIIKGNTCVFADSLLRYWQMPPIHEATPLRTFNQLGLGLGLGLGLSVGLGVGLECGGDGV